jgi:general secretion pathway protein G
MFIPFKQNGFTLIELLVVISIIGLLSTVALTSLNSARTKAHRAKAQVDVENLYQSLLRYNLDNNAWPSYANINTLAQWNASWNVYYPNVGNDPWGTAYYYDGPPNIECSAGASSVCSAGPNKVFNSQNVADRKVRADDICIYFEPEC